MSQDTSMTIDEMMAEIILRIESGVPSGSSIQEAMFFDQKMVEMGLHPDLLVLDLAHWEDKTIEYMNTHHLAHARNLSFCKERVSYLKFEQLEIHYKDISDANGGYVPEEFLIPTSQHQHWSPGDMDAGESGNSGNEYVSSDSEESDDGLAIPQIIADPSAKRYSREQLVAMIPRSAEFSSLREKIGLQKTVYRYSPDCSNRTFKRRYFFKERKLPKGLTKVPFVIQGDDLIPVLGKRKIRKTPFGGKPVLYRRKRFISNKKEAKEILVPKTKKMNRVFYPKVVPKPHHKKYWYFLRKTGSYRTSGHHPYGDEYEAYASDPT